MPGFMARRTKKHKFPSAFRKFMEVGPGVSHPSCSKRQFGCKQYADRTCCRATTTSGKRCKNCSITGSRFCGVHGGYGYY